MDANMKTIWLNRGLNLIMWISGTVASAAAAGQLPPWLVPWVPLISLAGIGAAKWAKTPSQAIAAAVAPSQRTAPPAPAP